MCNRVRDVSHGDDSSDGYVLDKQLMCQGTFANAHFAGKLQADHVWEGEEEKLPVKGMGKAATFFLQHSLAMQPGPVFEVTQIIWYCLSMHHTKLLKLL